MSLRDYFDQRAREGSWGSLYDGPVDLSTYNFLTRRRAVFDLLRGAGDFRRILDVGCGTGDYAEIAQRHRGSYFGIDFAPAMVEQARRRQSSGAHFAAAAGEELPFPDDSFDLVLALGYIAYFADPTDALREIQRVLAPGGTLIMQVSKPDLVGALDRWLLLPMRSVFRRRRPAADAPPPGWVNLRYPGRSLDRLVGCFGFERTARVHNHFNVLPWFLRRRFPDAAVRISDALTHRHPNLWRALAVNYIGRYSLVMPKPVQSAAERGLAP